MKIYNSSVAPNPRRVRIFLAEKGIEVPYQEIDLAKAENRQPEFRQINPLSAVPVLGLDDGTYIAESIAICRYFEELHPDPLCLGSARRNAQTLRCGSGGWNLRCWGLSQMLFGYSMSFSRDACANVRSTPLFANKMRWNG